MTTLSTQERGALGDALLRMLRDHYSFTDGRRRNLATGPDTLPPVWTSLLDLGLAALVVPEAHGGFGGGCVDVQRVQRILGRTLVVSPWLGVALGAQLIERAASPAQHAQWLRAVAEGRMTLALAHEDAVTLQASHAPVGAQDAGQGWYIHGSQTDVLHARAVSHLLVWARLPDGAQGWFLVETAQDGVQCKSHQLVDQQWAADVRFHHALAQRLEGLSPVRTNLLRAAQVAAYCAEMVGGAEASLTLTVQYLRTRQQFGQPLADYQALRHRVAEMSVAMEQLRSAEELASEAVDVIEPVMQARRSAQALLVGCTAATWIQQQAIQLHGGMGMTEELAIGHYYRRQLVINALTGGENAASNALIAAVP